MGLCVVSYDIAKTKTRNQLSKVLEKYGSRVQYSVFECDLEYERFLLLCQDMMKVILDEKTDSIRIYRICGKCEEQSVFLGNQEKGIRQLMKNTIVI